MKWILIINFCPDRGLFQNSSHLATKNATPLPEVTENHMTFFEYFHNNIESLTFSIIL